MNEMDVYGQLTPEEVQKLSGGGALQDQYDAVEQQIAQARALRNRPQSKHTTGVGALFGGIGDALNAGAGIRDEQLGLNQQAGIRDRQTDIRALLSDKLNGLLRAQVLRAAAAQPPAQPQPQAGFDPVTGIPWSPDNGG